MVKVPRSKLGGWEGGSAVSRQLLCSQAAATEELLPGVDVLLEVFPTCSVEQAQWVLAKARGDLEAAVQMLVEGKEEGPLAWEGPSQVSSSAPPNQASPHCTLMLSPHPYSPHLFPLWVPSDLDQAPPLSIGHAQTP